MILHIANFHWKSEVTEERVAALTAALTEMAAQLDCIQSYAAGPNLHLRPGGSDYAVAAIVADGDALDAYLDHPLHQQVYTDFLGTMLESREAAQLPIASGSFA
ncbi:Dabb family protein [Leucobacter allii]|uniref:Dabb family protein n=1 Tax=Leucobacter allii TaxID=2932247 RepID=A0ABY4FKS3_9MICO|nr:Dabb family protein [Leucobacter allii]UOQ56867.1 Dabb family protein [Leucobacter allii]